MISVRLYLIIIEYVCYEALFFQPLYFVDSIINESLNIFFSLSCEKNSNKTRNNIEHLKKRPNHKLKKHLLWKKLYPANSHKYYLAMQ